MRRKEQAEKMITRYDNTMYKIYTKDDQPQSIDYEAKEPSLIINA